METLVRYEFADGIATLSMDDGKVNVMSLRMLQALHAAFDRARADRAVVVLAGRERVFSGGFDLAAFKRDREELYRMLEAGAKLAERLAAFPHPIVAACTGHAVAMGAFLLLSADLRIGVDRDARVHINEVQIGMTLPWFAIEICRMRLAPPALNRAMLTAEPYFPQQALAAGFFDELAAPEALLKVARERAAALAKLDAGSFTATKQRVRQHALEALREAVQKDLADWAHFLPQPGAAARA